MFGEVMVGVVIMGLVALTFLVRCGHSAREIGHCWVLWAATTIGVISVVILCFMAFAWADALLAYLFYRSIRQ